MTVTWHRDWHKYLSVEHRRHVAYRARVDAFEYTSAGEGRSKRFVADVLAMRRVAQDHPVGRYIDAAFERVKGPRALMAPAFKAAWRDGVGKAAWRDGVDMLACVVATAVRQIVDIAACTVGVLVGLARLGLAVQTWGHIRATASSQVLRDSVARELHQEIALHLRKHAWDVETAPHQFAIDHHRLSMRVGDACFAPSDALNDKLEALRALCDDDPEWATRACLLLTQYPLNCAIAALARGGQLRLGALAVGPWSHAQSDSKHHVFRDGDDLVVHARCDQSINAFMVGQVARHAVPHDFPHDDNIVCAGDVGYRVEMRLARPRAGQPLLDTLAVTRVDIHGTVVEPAEQRDKRL